MMIVFGRNKLSLITATLLTTITMCAGFSPQTLAAGSPRIGNSERGAQIFVANCRACHSLDTNRVGPSLRGVYGRTVGTVVGFNYSASLRKRKFVWSAQILDRWLQGPEGVVPGTRMRFRLVEQSRRADVIAYLIQQKVSKAEK